MCPGLWTDEDKHEDEQTGLRVPGVLRVFPVKSFMQSVNDS